MSVTDALDAMRSELSGCSLVAYTDLSSGLVLSASAIGQPGQEELDTLSGAARQALTDVLADGARSVWSASDPQAPAETAMLLTAAEARVFIRSPGEAPEALLCVCAPDSDLNAVVDCGRTTLTRILGENG